MSKKKIAFVTLNYGGGGAEKIFTKLIENFCNNFNICAITFTNDGVYYDRIKQKNVKLYTLKRKINNTIFYSIRLAKILKKEKPDKVISFLYYPNIIVYLTSLIYNYKYIVCERSNHRLYLKNTLKHKIWKFLLKKSYQKAIHVVAVSEKTKKFIIEDFKIDKNKIQVIYNGINFEELDFLSLENTPEFNKDLKHIVAVGRLSEAKNYPLLLNSFSLLLKKHQKVHLHILGDGENKNVLQNLIKEKNLDKHVTLYGFIKNPYPYMKNADCYVLSSKWEGFPNVLIEALYLNGHVVSTNCDTGPAEIINHGYDGLLTPVDNEVALAENIEKMLYDNDLRENVFKNSRNTIKRFDEKIMIYNFRKILE